ARPALNIDIPATLLDLAGVPAPAIYQGRSLRPLLDGRPPADWRTDFFYEHLLEATGPGHPGLAVSIPKSEGVRTERFTYVRWFEQTPVVEELYDHEADFAQTKNLIADPAFAAEAERLRKRTTELRDQYGGPYVPNVAPKPAAATQPAAGKKAKGSKAGASATQPVAPPADDR
ncbi:MAG: hypothetical protein JWO31_2542, partial [Phycisphaerales bacterium]|nr:hypothetical protein [Phycisphaerales bacterium]